jgi:hypothetical protein
MTEPIRKKVRRLDLVSKSEDFSKNKHAAGGRTAGGRRRVRYNNDAIDVTGCTFLLPAGG